MTIDWVSIAEAIAQSNVTMTLDISPALFTGLLLIGLGLAAVAGAIMVTRK